MRILEESFHRVSPGVLCMRRCFLAAFFALAVCTGRAPAQPELLPTTGYGSLAGKITMKGQWPEPKDLTKAMMAKDGACCLSPKMKPEEKIDMTWLVDKKTMGVANVMVWVVAPKGKY